MPPVRDSFGHSMTSLVCETISAKHSVVIDSLPKTDDLLEYVEGLCASAIPQVVYLPKRLSLGDETGEARDQLRWLELIRDCTACGLRVRWSALYIAREVLPHLRHLAPPQVIENASESVGLWRENHFFGMFHWRRGPGFATLLDKRDPALGNQFILDDRRSYEVFIKARTTSARSTLAQIDVDALERLESEKIILSISGWSLALPYRLTHWPVPFTSV